jgi:hypothetical protein
MKASPLKQTDKAPYLKIVNNNWSKKRTSTEQVKRIYINTLIPGFNYLNHNGELITPKKCVLL